MAEIKIMDAKQIILQRKNALIDAYNDCMADLNKYNDHIPATLDMACRYRKGLYLYRKYLRLQDLIILIKDSIVFDKQVI